MSAPPPERICLLRLSALGDVTHVLPLVQALKRARPERSMTWVIGRTEHRLLDHLPGIEFVVYDKTSGWSGMRTVWRRLADRRFDALLLLQLALRAGLLSAGIRARRRLGFDRVRSKELHGLFVSERIEYRAKQHVVDALLSFAALLGIEPGPPEWSLPIPAADRAAAEALLPGDPPTLLISPCSSHPLRNWHAAGYAAIADYAAEHHGLRVALIGGRSVLERQMADQILALARRPIVDLVGKDTLKQSLALIQRARVLLSPDSGPVHFANALGTPVVGLYAATDPERSGPYRFRHLCTRAYTRAAERFLRRPADALPWGTKIERPGVMDLITTDEVRALLDQALRQAPGVTGRAPPVEPAVPADMSDPGAGGVRRPGTAAE